MEISNQQGEQWKVLELFAGIGGLAAAWRAAKVVAAIDINHLARQTYQRNYSHPYLIREIESISDAEFASWGANFWWLSPPCQPYSRRGQRRDTADPRARPLLRMIDAIEAYRPTAIGLENVVGFGTSSSHELLRQRLVDCGYNLATLELCPSQMGWPNRRPRFYLLASQHPLVRWQPLPVYDVRLQDFLLPEASAELSSDGLWLERELLARLSGAIDRVDPERPDAVAACFAGSYGKTFLHAGSYVLVGDRYRRFSPREVARLMGFADSFQLGPLGNRAAWKLLGNSLSIPAVRYILSHLRHG